MLQLQCKHGVSVRVGPSCIRKLHSYVRSPLQQPFGQVPSSVWYCFVWPLLQLRRFCTVSRSCESAHVGGGVLRNAWQRVSQIVDPITSPAWRGMSVDTV